MLNPYELYLCIQSPLKQLALGFLLAVASPMVCEGQEVPPEVAAELKKLREELKETNDSLVETQEEVIRLRNGVPASAFLPPPADPGNLFFDETNLADTNLGAGVQVFGSAMFFRAAATGVAQMWYDTGAVGSGATFDPSTIFPGGSAAQGAGNFNLVDAGGQLKLDLNVPMSEDEQAQAYLETNYLNGELHIRHAFGRAQFSAINVLAGSYWTAWGDEGAIPKSIGSNNSFVSGVNSLTSVPQVRIAIPTESGWVTTLAIQQPVSGPIEVAAPDDITLHRYPDFAARIRYFDGDFASLSVGGLYHVIGRETATGLDSFANGWGVSAATRFRLTDRSTVMLGAVGGEGISGTIFGLSDTLSAGNSASGEFIPLRNYGTYVGYQHKWSDCAFSTFAYGFAEGDGMPANAPLSRTTQNAWANLIYKPTQNFAFGLQYDYGDRYLGNATSGENHRISLVISVSAGQNEKLENEAAIASSADVEGRPLSPGEGGASRFSRL